MVMAASIGESRYPPPSRSTIAAIFDRLVALCGVVPYALVAVGLRLIMARVFFTAGQSKIAGPVVTLPGLGREGFPVVLPAEIRDSTFRLFETEYAGLPLPPAVAAYLFTYAEFVLPICLVLGFATRLSALALMILTVLVQVYVAPAALWTTHVYWFAILMVLMSVGPGAISLDRAIRYLYEK
jgi:putative oxidoreductase